MPYMSAAEKRRQRAEETAHDMEQEKMFDGFGRNEKTGLGGRANHVESLTRATQPPPPSHADQDFSHHSPYQHHSPPVIGGGSPHRLQQLQQQQPIGYQASEVSAVAPSSVAFGGGRGRGGMAPSSVVSALPYRPPQPVSSTGGVAPSAAHVHQYDPDMFSNAGGSPARPQKVPAPLPRRQQPPPQQPAASSEQRWADPVPQPRGGVSPGRRSIGDRQLPAMDYTPPPPQVSYAADDAVDDLHPLEYDGGAPLPDVVVDSHFGGRHVSNVPTRADAAVHQNNLNASSRALDEYYNRTRGPIIDDRDRVAIENFFATDDFTEQFNAKAAALRAGGKAQQQQQHMSPSKRGGANGRPRLPPVEPMPAAGGDDDAGAGADGDDDDPRYPLCHRCHQAALAAEDAVRRSTKATKTGAGRAVSGQPKRPPRKVPAMKPTTGRGVFR